jgi:hypothetical protein
MRKREMCAFCSETSDITREHIWDKWLVETLGVGKFTMVRKEVDGEVLKWQSKKLDWETKVVCGDCNSGWMSDLVNRTKTIAKDMILTARESVLSPADIETIASYGFMKSVVADQSHENRESFFTLSERRSFRQTLSIPDGVQMWFASLPFQHGLFKSMTIETPLNTPRRFEVNVFTYGVGHLVIQVAASRWKKKAFRRHTPPPVLTQGSEWDVCSLPFWPPKWSRTFSWPPAHHMSLNVCEKFAKRWTTMERGWL